jgi:hypothetical protein
MLVALALAGCAADNADGVDLNRNFPFRWQRLGPRGTVNYGPTAFVVELPAGMLSAGAVRRYVDAIRAVSAMN